jgi:hypothetical protein
MKKYFVKEKRKKKESILIVGAGKSQKETELK